MAEQRTFYMPWTDGVHNYEPGFRTAAALAAERHRPLTVVLPHKNHLKDYMRRFNVVTPRSGSVPPGSFVVAMYPNLRMMSRFFHVDDDHPFMVVDYHGNAMGAWAQINGAMSTTDGRAMIDERPAEVREIHKQIADSGYNGFTSPPGSYVIKSQLQDLDGLGWLDKRGRSYLTGYLLSDRSEQSIEDLQRLTDKWFGKLQ